MMTEIKVAAAIAQSNAREEAARAMLAALKMAEDKLTRLPKSTAPGSFNPLGAVRAAIAAAEGAGITAEER